WFIHSPSKWDSFPGLRPLFCLFVISFFLFLFFPASFCREGLAPFPSHDSKLQAVIVFIAKEKRKVKHNFSTKPAACPVSTFLNCLPAQLPNPGCLIRAHPRRSAVGF